MSDTFRAFVVNQVDGQYAGAFKQLSVSDLPDEKVLVDIAYSSLNYKDGLAVLGRGRGVVRNFPMVCGIDLAGTVAESKDPRFKTGDKVLALGGGLSETLWGGYSARQRINPDLLVKIPQGLTETQVMAIGTAGYTAMVSIMFLEDEGVTPDKGEIIVPGAAGGVGSVAVAILAKLGYRVVASTGRPEAHDYLKSLGAAEVLARADLDKQAKPLEPARWAGGVDSVGGRTLATVLAQTKPQGVITCCGLAGGNELPATVMPFILRGVKLLGVNYFEIPAGWRETAWKRLVSDLDRAKLDSMTEIEPLSDIQALAEKILRGKTRGRVVIDVNK